MPSYSVYGLTLRSDLPIGGLSAAQLGCGSADDVKVHFGFCPRRATSVGPSVDWHESVARDAAGEPLLRIQRIPDTGELWLRYADGTQFLIAASADSVYAIWPPDFSIDDAIIYLLGPVLGIVLRMRGRTCLHASVAAADGRALGFMGPAGSGKSTVAAAFARAGHPVLSDDALVLMKREDRFWAVPGYPRLRLWPPSVEGLYGSRDAQPLLVRGWEKRYVDLAAEGVFLDEPSELGAIYVIGDRQTDLAEAAIEPMSRREALMSLIANSYTGHLPGRSPRRREFELFSRLVSEVPVRRLVPSDDWSSLDRLPTAVLDDFAEVSRARAG